MTKGFRGSSSVLFRPANQRLMKALVFAYEHRRLKKRFFRRLWIARINAAVRHYNLNYSVFIYDLKAKNSQLNRKWLSELAIREPSLFKQLIKEHNNSHHSKKLK